MPHPLECPSRRNHTDTHHAPTQKIVLVSNFTGNWKWPNICVYQVSHIAYSAVP